jgi:endogenous inhibitor of DNA gyrase (YacG/DUF329 family)
MPTEERCRTCHRLLPNGIADRHFPFCSARCRDRDLGQWLNGSYAVVQELDSHARTTDVDSK